MHSIAPWETETVVTAWAKADARRELREADEALDSARAALLGLAADTQWRSEGVRAMQDAIDDLARRTGAVGITVRFSVRQVEAVALP